MDKSGNTEVKRMLNILKEKATLTVVIVVAFVMLGFIYSYYYVVPKYQTTETLLLIPNNTADEQMITNSDLMLNSELISTYSNIAKQSIVLKQVIQNLNLNIKEKDLLNKLKVSVTSDTYIIEVTVTDVNPKIATDIARELSNVFLKEIKQIYNLENIGIVDEAEFPTVPYNINHAKDIIMFGMIGVFTACIAVLAFYLFDNTIKTEEEIEEYIKLKTLGKIPINISKTGEIANKENSKSYVTECINTIRTNILYMNSVKNAKTILITSCLSQEGKSWISANIAAAFAETNKNVLIIDADMRKGRANKIFNIDNEEGLSNYLYSMTGDIKGDIELATKYIKETEIPNLHILPNGTIPPNPAELVDSNNMKNLLEILKNIYDIVIIDSPPCMLVTDSVILSTIVDSTILVVNSESTKIKNLLEVKKSIKIVGGNLIGVILNKIKLEGKTYSKSYYYGHTKDDDKCEIKQREIISVEEIIDNAIPKFEAKGYEILSNEDKEENIEEKTVADKDNIEKIYSEQSKNIEKLIETVADIKVQLNRNERNYDRRTIKTENDINNVVELINLKLEELRENNKIEMQEQLQTINYESKINHISKEIKGLNHLDRLDEIYNELEKVKDIFKENDNKAEVGNAIGKIYNEIRVIKENHKQLTSEVVTREDIAEILRQENRTNQNLTKADISDIVRQEVSRSREAMEDNLTIKVIQNIVKQELANINYTAQINQIQEMMEILKDNYLELSNKLDKENIEEEVSSVNSNIVSINLFRKDKKKRKSYSIYEDISYDDLEETATCVVPFISQESFDGKVASK